MAPIRKEIAKNATSGDRSSAIAPMRTGGRSLRSGTRTGSVIVYRNPATVAMEPCGEIGNQDSTTRTSRTNMYNCRSVQIRDAMVEVAAQLVESVSSSRLRSSAETSTSAGVSRYTWLVTRSICPSVP